jgi:biotin transport system substrate-specific component
LAQFSFFLPGGVPLTLQTLAVALVGFVAAPGMCAASIGLYILLGGLGLPVFASFRGGYHVLVGATGGFIFGFLLLGVFCSLSMKASGRAAPVSRVLLPAGGLLLCHVAGVTQYALVTGNPWGLSAGLVSAPFLIKDAASVGLAYLIGRAVNRQLAHLQSGGRSRTD